MISNPFRSVSLCTICFRTVISFNVPFTQLKKLIIYWYVGLSLNTWLNLFDLNKPRVKFI